VVVGSCVCGVGVVGGGVVGQGPGVVWGSLCGVGVWGGGGVWGVVWGGRGCGGCSGGGGVGAGRWGWGGRPSKRQGTVRYHVTRLPPVGLNIHATNCHARSRRAAITPARHRFESQCRRPPAHRPSWRHRQQETIQQVAIQLDTAMLNVAVPRHTNEIALYIVLTSRWVEWCHDRMSVVVSDGEELMLRWLQRERERGRRLRAVQYVTVRAVDSSIPTQDSGAGHMLVIVVASASRDAQERRHVSDVHIRSMTCDSFLPAR